MNCPLKVTQENQALTDNESIALAFIKLANVKLELASYKEVFLPESLVEMDEEGREEAVLSNMADKELINHALAKLNRVKMAIKNYQAELDVAEVDVKAQADVIDATSGLLDIERYLNEIEAELRVELVEMEAEFKAELDELEQLNELDTSKKHLSALIRQRNTLVLG